MAAIDALIVEHTPLVHRIAGQLMRNLPTSIECDDLRQSGMLGLLDAVKRYDASQGVPFVAFAYPRIHGAIMDDLRALDWLPRSTRAVQKALAIAVRQTEQRECRRPGASDLAATLGVTLEAYFAMVSTSYGHPVVSIDEPVENDPFLERNVLDEAPEPAQALEDKQFAADLAEHVGQLPKRQRTVLKMQEAGLGLQEIGARLNVTESRACQIRAEAVRTLRAGLEEWI